MKIEIWKTVLGYNGDYVVSNLGNVISFKYNKRRVLKPDSPRGYSSVILSNNNIQKRFLVHRLVAMAFIPNIDNKDCVNHKNGMKKDNRVKNLEWCTHSENERHSYDILGKINANRKLKENDIKYIMNNYKKGVGGNISFLAKKYNVDRKTISNVINKRFYV